MEILVLVSFSLFCCLHSTVTTSSLFIPFKIRLQGTATIWKWTNTLNSLLHSFITGLGALICFYLNPAMINDVITAYSPLARGLTAFSIGYFIFDLLDMLIHNGRSWSSLELMLHHAFVLSCFGVAMWTQLYLGFVMVALVIEINSVFLHWRRLLLLCHTPKTSSYYGTVSLLNIMTFLVFRVIPLGWMACWLANNSQKISPRVHVLGSICIVTIVIMSTVLFYRVVRADYFPCRKTEDQATHLKIT